jgi:hypothetical protein
MNVKTMGFTLAMAALFSVTIWTDAGSQAAAQALVTVAPRPGASSASLATEATVPRTQEPGSEQGRKVLESYGRLPLSFTENQGQADDRIAYYIQSPGRSVYFTKDGHALRLTQGKGEDARAHTIKVELVGAAPERIEGLERAPGIVSYFKGPKEQWSTSLGQGSCQEVCKRGQAAAVAFSSLKRSGPKALGTAAILARPGRGAFHSAFRRTGERVPAPLAAEPGDCACA